MRPRRDHLYGASKLVDSLELTSEDNLIIVGDENNKEFLQHILTGVKAAGLTNAVLVVLPDALRPTQALPDSLAAAVTKAQGLIHIVNRLPEENFLFNRPLLKHCRESECRYIYIYDPKLSYLCDGISADYEKVDRKAEHVRRVLEDSTQVRVTSQHGTDVSFSLYTHDIRARSPVFHDRVSWKQAPEGEVMSCPVESTFSGTVVVDGVITGLGQPSRPVVWEFADGLVTHVDGDKEDLEQLLVFLQKSDARLRSLVGMDIAEFSVGVNDWAVYDDNISNCEKVSGGIHFGLGQVSGGIGIYRGGTFHFDNILMNPTVVVKKTDGQEVTLIKDGIPMF